MNYLGKINSKVQFSFSFFYYVLSSLILLSCNSNSIQVESNNLLSKTDFCSNNQEHSYEVYIPSGSKKCHKLPYLLILDPQGEGKAAIELFIPAAEEYKFILIASNQIKNNIPGFISDIDAIRKDISKKYPVNEQIVIAGFSGGARMALTYAQYNSVDGVIACGALAPSEQIVAIGSVVYGVTGMADFNFVEAAQYLFRPENAPENLRVEFTGDLHKWPAKEEITRLVGYLYFENEFSTQKCLDFTTLKNNYLEDQTRRSDKFINTGDYVSAYTLLHNLTYLDVLNDSEKYLKIYNSTNYEDKLNNQFNLLRESIRLELQVRDAYYKELAVKDIDWWQHEITLLNERIDDEKNKYNALAYQRIKAFLGIMCYSLTNSALQGNDLLTASRLLPVYAYLEPENPDMLYFHALYANLTGNASETESYLQRAIDAGYDEEEKIVALKATF